MAIKDVTDGVREIGLFDNAWVARGLGIVLAYILWTTVAWYFPNRIMPFPGEALMLAWGLLQSGVAISHITATLWLTFWGFVGALVIGSIVGVLVGINNYSQRFFTPYIIVGLTIPAIAAAAITRLIFGFTNIAPVSATILITFPYVAINVWKGVESIDIDLLYMVSSFDVSRYRIVKRVILPSIAPSLFTAFRFGLAISWKIVTVAEMVSASKGIGYKLIGAYQVYKFEEAWAWAILFMGIILIIEYGIFKPLERKVFEYRQDADFQLLG